MDGLLQSKMHNDLGFDKVLCLTFYIYNHFSLNETPRYFIDALGKRKSFSFQFNTYV